MRRYWWGGAPSQKVKLLQSAQLAQISRCRSLLLQKDDNGLVFGGSICLISTVGFLGQIVPVVGAGEVWSGVGTLASPMGGRGQAAGEQDTGRPKGPHPSSLPPPPLRGESASLPVSQNTYP